MEDQHIIELFWNRSQEALKHVGAKYGAYCFKIAYNILLSREDGEECVSDTYMQAWDSIPPQRPAILKAFLGKITRNIALNRYESMHARKRGSGQTALCLDELSECLPGGDDPQELVQALALRDVINLFLKKQGEDDRKIFVLRYWYMEPVRSIADGMGFSQSKVKMTLMRLREKLRQELNEHDFSV
jgi:RNA polymerase sigma-70 factor (ECF subfamily)